MISGARWCRMIQICHLIQQVKFQITLGSLCCTNMMMWRVGVVWKGYAFFVAAISLPLVTIRKRDETSFN
jgi:hypothetical protein